MSTYYIAGASRGIGLELVRQTLLNYEGSKVIAGARNIESNELHQLKHAYPDRLTLVTLDIGSTASAAAEVVAKTHPEGIDYLINNGAVRDSADLDSDPDEMVRVFNINSAGPLRVFNSVLPLIKKGSRKVVVNVSSMAGSFAQQPLLHQVTKLLGSPSYGYSVSKAGLNLLTISLSLAYAADGIIIIPVHPGAVETDLAKGGVSKRQHAPNQSPSDLEFLKNLAKWETPAASARLQLELYHKLQLKDSGKFFSYTGEQIEF